MEWCTRALWVKTSNEQKGRSTMLIDQELNHSEQMIQDRMTPCVPSEQCNMPMLCSRMTEQPSQRTQVLRWRHFFHTDSQQLKIILSVWGMTDLSLIVDSCLKIDCEKQLEVWGSGNFPGCSVAPSDLQGLREELFDLNANKGRH